ncbi:MAG: Peptidyl-prolyl isomerase cwc27 [Cirrosporium novae-zelandiae]|nr:MAG: Peptidyl-prolyl isomerase cwc27 [Cirrosporium novae-zelandiae]
MSTVYNLEPPPTAKVLLQTTAGDILLELFAKQTPLASRNFLQLCLDGYYTNTMFHRLVPGFIIQGGDPTGTGAGGEAIYPGGLFEDEFHSRLKFNRRGLLGMANSGRKDDNGSQFFLTLGATEELNGKNTMFGRVVGDTIYNLMKMGEAELEEESERPLYPTKVTGSEILVNPFEDMVRRQPKSRELPQRMLNETKKKPKKKAGKALLSFGDEEADVDATPVVKKAKFNTTLIKGDERNKMIDSKPQKTETKPIRRRTSISSPPKQPERNLQLPIPDPEVVSRSESSSPEPAQVSKVSSLLDRTNAQIAELKASMKRNVPAPPEPKTKKSALEQMIPTTSTRGRKRKHGGTTNGPSKEELKSLKLLDAFKAKLDQAIPTEKGPTAQEFIDRESEAKADDLEGADDEEATLCDLHFIANCQSCRSWDQQPEADDGNDKDDRSWMSHVLSFEKDRLGKDLNWKRQNEDELVVIDPKEKSKDIKQGQRSRKQGKEGTGREWDRARDRDRAKEKRRGFAETNGSAAGRA